MATDGIAACKWHALVRFGMWEEILAEPADPDWAKVNHCMRHYARGVALANTGRADEARAEVVAFDDAVKGLDGLERWLGNQPAAEIMPLARLVLRGESEHEPDGAAAPVAARCAAGSAARPAGARQAAAPRRRRRVGFRRVRASWRGGGKRHRWKTSPWLADGTFWFAFYDWLEKRRKQTLALSAALYVALANGCRWRSSFSSVSKKFDPCNQQNSGCFEKNKYRHTSCWQRINSNCRAL